LQLVAEEWHPLFNGVGGVSSFGRFQAVETVFSQFWEVLLIGIGICEGFRISRGYNDPKDIDQIQESYIPGDLGFDPLGLCPEDEDALYDMKTKELNHGRLAMIAIAAFAAQEDIEKNTSIWRELVERNIVPKEEANLLPY
jgi:Chlorophyll A-B binding protein